MPNFESTLDKLVPATSNIYTKALVVNRNWPDKLTFHHHFTQTEIFKSPHVSTVSTKAIDSWRT